MHTENPFDKKLDLSKEHIPSEVQEAAIFVHDTLDLCWASAQSIFGEKATPESALRILDHVLIESAKE